MPMMSGGVRRGSRGCLRGFLLVLSIFIVVYVFGVFMYGKRGGTIGRNRSEYEVDDEDFGNGCASCVCDCPPQLSLHKMVPGLVSLSFPDCGKDDPELSKEMSKPILDLLSEEIRLQAVVANENNKHMNLTIIQAKRLGTQYQRELDKCNAATETCEEAREHAEASLRNERRLTSQWERRARELGWTN
ncbi:hypothetical protein ZOSMA_136G00280 [Zostera marina]|uniref:Uncharacterized protein n=1 Tax=Zostera marina TaxID=29655 RepID=A0A0K9Q0U0_ZOSMR|nr:hypothetical protein ZOSMA_136G00280 [Zostera marina]